MSSLSRELVFLILQFLDEEKFKDTVHRPDYGKAVEVLRKDLKVFSTFNDDLFKEITLLLTLPNFSLNWQHQLCKNPKSNPDIKTLFVDHSCGQANGARVPSPVTNQLMGSMPKVGGFPPLGAHGPFQASPASITASLGGWMANPSTMPHQGIPGGPISLSAPNNAASMLKRPRTPTTNPAMDYHTADSDHALKRARPFGLMDEGNNLPINILPVTYPSQTHPNTSYSSDDLPKTVLANLNQGSAVRSMDFHPVEQTLLLVGTNIGDIAVWEVGSRDRLAFKNFKVWDLGSCSVILQASLANEYTASVNRVMWSPDGTLLGVAYSKHIVHIYSFHGGDELRNRLEIDAHVGNVSDLAFSHPNKQLCIITCGEDKAIKVWDVATGAKQFTFEGHEAPVYSVCPHHKENIQFIFSTSVDGKIKAWLYDNLGSRVDYDAPGQSCTRMAYSADGTRLFSCGTSKDGESHIVEWNESEGAVKRSYVGLGKRSMGVVQFDTTKNKFLVAGDEFVIKFWDVDNVNLLMTTDADGGLPASPCIRFSKEGILLAVSTSENGVKILGNAEGLRLVRTVDNRALDASRISGNVAKSPVIGAYGASSLSAVPNIGAMERSAPVTAIVPLNGDSRSLPDVNPRITDEMEKSKIWKLAEINEQAQLQSLRLPDILLSVRIARLIYTNSGGAILALACNAVHKLWKWQRNERNMSGKDGSINVFTATALSLRCRISPTAYLPANPRMQRSDSGVVLNIESVASRVLGEVSPC
uniref:TOPLESS zinc finger domain-containing protein n=1 Tax=Daucus carota subsp. sativus TaxID=79200 RepID=A0A164W506_DAUCS